MSTWWTNRAALRRVVCDLFAAELKAHDSEARHALGQARWTDATPVGEDGLGADSITRVGLAAALSEMLHLHEAGLEDHLLAQRTIGGWCDVAATCLRVRHERVTFRTSGSTAGPKRCPHTLATLEQEVRVHADLFASRRRVLAAVPSHHIYGFLFTVLLPHELSVGSPTRAPVPVVDIRWNAPGSVLQLLEPGDLIVGFPLLWSSVIRAVDHFTTEAWGVTSTSPCPHELSARLERMLGRLIDVYGASETGGIGWRDRHDAPYRLFPFWRRSGLGTLERTEHQGGACPLPEVSVPDVIEWQGPDTFFLEHRRDGAVQVAGVNVYPRRIEDLIRSHKDVAACQVRPMNPADGERLKAFIVPRDGIDPEPLRHELKAWIERHLSPAERPQVLRLGTRLPRDPLGKPGDWTP